MITTQRNRTLHALLHATCLMSQKANLVLGISGGRTEKSSELTDTEARELCDYLRRQLPQGSTPEKANTMRRKIIAMAHQMGWKTPDGRADMQRINHWCSQQWGKKPLNGYTLHELPKLVSIFEKVYIQFLHKTK
ncbi:MAG: regulatory protein GemA [Chitinophagaceae bacterium]|nr:regulatory protein GemA [Chitinophagaceae bacterium]